MAAFVGIHAESFNKTAILRDIGQRNIPYKVERKALRWIKKERKMESYELKVA